MEGNRLKLSINRKKLESYMLEKGWDEQELAKQIGLSHVQIFKLLRDQPFPENDFIAGIMAACKDMPIDDLFIFPDQGLK